MTTNDGHPGSSFSDRGQRDCKNYGVHGGSGYSLGNVANLETSPHPGLDALGGRDGDDGINPLLGCLDIECELDSMTCALATLEAHAGLVSECMDISEVFEATSNGDASVPCSAWKLLTLVFQVAVLFFFFAIPLNFHLLSIHRKARRQRKLGHCWSPSRSLASLVCRSYHACHPYKSTKRR